MTDKFVAKVDLSPHLEGQEGGGVRRGLPNHFMKPIMPTTIREHNKMRPLNNFFVGSVDPLGKLRVPGQDEERQAASVFPSGMRRQPSRGCSWRLYILRVVTASGISFLQEEDSR